MSCENSIFLILLITSINNEVRVSSYKIFGGEIVKPGEFPYMALIHAEASIWSGAIITEKHILTSAVLSTEHLISPYKDVLVKIGSNEYEELEEHHIRHFTVHPKFRKEFHGGIVRYDVAVIALCDRIDFNAKKQPAMLPRTEVRDGDGAFVTGWGITESGDVGVLHKLRTTVHSVENCFENPNDRSRICTKNEKGEGYCSGDGGSPLVVNGNVLVGTASIFNHACGNGLDTYVNIYECLDYIHGEIHPLTCKKQMNYTTVRTFVRPFVREFR